MSRAAKLTLLGAVVVSGATIYGVHWMQVAERETMHRGVERDQARQAEKQRQRAIDLQINQEKERQFQQMQPTKGWLARIRGGGGDQSTSQQPDQR